jgi:hypothetical protein
LRFTDVSSGSDRDSTRAADRASASAAESGAFADLWLLLSHSDPEVRRRAVAGASKAGREDPALLALLAAQLLSGPAEAASEELAWQLLPVAARLALPAEQAARLMRRCEDAVLNHPSHVVQAEALSAAFTIADRDRRHVARVRSLARTALRSPSAALAARARQLLGGE